MAYYSDAVTQVSVDGSNRFAVMRAHCIYECVQLYIDGELAGSATPWDHWVEFALPPLSGREVIWALAVDAEDAETDYYDEAYPGAAANANRIRLYIIAYSTYDAEDKAKFYRGDAGDESADTLISEQALFPAGQGKGGWGQRWGRHWGRGPYGLGWGHTWGRSWGYGAPRIEYTTEPLPPGTYAVKVVIVDMAGNESTAATDSVAVASYAAAATDLTIDSYTLGTDTLVLSLTASGDI